MNGTGVMDALVLLTLVWAVLLIPSALRSRRASPHATVGGFERAMNVLRATPRATAGRQLLVPDDAGRIVGPPHHESGSLRSDTMTTREDPLIARRRRNFYRASIATLVTLVAAVVLGGWAWPVFALVAAGTVSYVAILRRLKLQRDEARRVVRELDLTVEEPVVQPRVAVGNGGEELTHGSVRLRRWDH